MGRMRKCALITNDVETTSILNHKLRDKTADYLVGQGMPRLLDVYDRYSVRATFFFTGHVARLKPELVKTAQARGHEIGSHGMTHDAGQSFDVLPLGTQIRHLQQSKKILEDISGREVVSFRAPAARIGPNLTAALEHAGYRIDSSVASQRLDMMFSFGSLKKLNWLVSPRHPYFASETNIFKKGESSILEIPISAFGIPYIGTALRIAPVPTRIVRWLLYSEAVMSGRPINFLTHPNEFIDEDLEDGKIERRGSRLPAYLLGDLIRHKLKTINLGRKGLPLLHRELSFFREKQFVFQTCKDYYRTRAANSPAGRPGVGS
jgi:peptidoglycan-N-acetylglucosamine deacetylase